MECSVRLRVEFDDHRHRHLLNKSQRSVGLHRCWLRLRPDLSTVSDLAAHLVSAFDLRRSCPHGVLLYMEDFVLPSFESTSIFRDNDIVRVRRKDIKRKLLETHGDGYHIQDSEIVEKKPILFVDKLLAIKDFQEDLEADKSENEVDACDVEENTTNRQTLSSEERKLKRKRKRSSNPQNSKRKKSEHISSEKNIIIDNQEENILDQTHSLSDEDENFDKLMNSQNEVQKENLSIDTEERDDQFENTGEIQSEPPITDVMKKCCRSSKRKKAKRQWKREQAKQQLEKKQGEAPENYVEGTSSDYQDHDKLIEQEENIIPVTLQPDREDKDGNMQSNGTVVLSRSARRKKAKRQWLRGLAKPQIEKIQGEVLANDMQCKSSEDQVEDEAADSEEEDIVPIIVRPGHIRFEPQDEEHRNKQSNGSVETLKWNGTTRKKKGQKWGREKDTTMQNEDDTYSGASRENFITDEKHENEPIDFESLFPLTRLPEEGDLLVYRVVELASSWCPELSDFRVGKVSSYDPISTKIVLLPVLEYPIFPNEDEEKEESAQQPEPTLYKEDGSLEIEYTSLLDIRLLKAHDSDDQQSLKSKEVARPYNRELTPSETNSKKSAVPPSETVSSVSWEQQIEQALNEKKAQLEKNDGWATWTPHKSTTTTTSRSYRLLRERALGPTLAMIRGQNGGDDNANSSGKHTSGKRPSSE